MCTYGRAGFGSGAGPAVGTAFGAGHGVELKAHAIVANRAQIDRQIVEEQRAIIARSRA